MKKIILIAFILVSTISHAQVNVMATDSINTCVGTFESSLRYGGPTGTGAGYANSENFTKTICPGSAGSIVAIDFTSFALGAGDMLTVYNGSNTSAPLLGVYDVTNPLVGVINAMLATNSAGCLTFVFVSDAAGTAAGWDATISCTIPCQQYDVVIDTLMPDTNAQGFLDVCFQDTSLLQLKGVYTNNNQNYHQADSTTTFYWMEGTDTLGNGNPYQFSPDHIVGGEIRVIAVDTMGCVMDPNITLTYRVSTIPSFVGTQMVNDTICFGDTNFLKIQVAPTNFNNIIPRQLGVYTALPDKPSNSPAISYNMNLVFTGFATGLNITNVSQLDRIWVNMEHSYLGDLLIQIRCPNGTTAILKGNTGGAGRWLGEACDNSLLVPGVGYNYEWKPTGNSQLDMVTHSGTCVGCPSVANPCGGFNGTTLQAGSYTPVQALSRLVGCPLNGQWRLTVTDNLTQDDGFIFSWGIDFASSLYPINQISYTPGIDSVWVAPANSAPSVTSMNATADTMMLVPQIDSTTFCYSVNVLDSFGCVHDSIFCFFVRDRCDPGCYNPSGPLLTETKVSCAGGTDGQLKILPDTNQIPYPWTYIWSDSNGTILQTTLSVSVADSLSGLPEAAYSVEIIDGNGCASNWTFNLGTIRAMQLAVPTIGQTSCAFVRCDASATASVQFGTAPYSYAWSGGDSTLSASSLCAGINVLTVTDFHGCVDTISFTVTEPLPISVTGLGDTLICVGNTTDVSGIASGGTPPYTYSWAGGFGNMANVNVSPTVNHQYAIYVTDTNNCPPDTATIQIDVRPPLQVDMFGPDTLCLYDTVKLKAIAHGGDSIYFYTWEQGIGKTSKVTTSVTTSQYYSVTINDQCKSNTIEDSVFVQVGGYPKLGVDISPGDTVCLGDQVLLTAQGIGGDGKYSYVWDHGVGSGPVHIEVPTQATKYSVTVTDQCLTPAGIASVIVEVGNFEEFEAMVDTVVNCDPGTFVFEFDTVNPNFHYRINFGNGYELVNPLEPISRSFTVDGCHAIKVSLETNLGCVSTKEYPCMFTILPTPQASFDFNSHHPDILQPFVDFWDNSIGADSWTWYTNDTVLSKHDKFTTSFPKEGWYNIKLVVSNSYGCTDSTNTDLPVAFKTTYYFPSAFTPNNDGVNDVFKIEGAGMKSEDFVLQVFDRWGGIVFESGSITQGWNGKFNNTGDPLMSGTYTYSYTLRLHDGRIITDFGSVSLIK
tara:strand:- start:75852 stop:79493 length:3642 start_codon:yes stop_codon:yes gene_type:complete